MHADCVRWCPLQTVSRSLAAPSGCRWTHTYPHSPVIPYTHTRLSNSVSSWAQPLLMLLAWAISAPYCSQWNCSQLSPMHDSNTTCDSSTTHVLSNTQMLHNLKKTLNTPAGHEYVSAWGEKNACLLFVPVYTFHRHICLSEYLLHYVFAGGPYGCFHFRQFYLVPFELCCAAALF